MKVALAAALVALLVKWLHIGGRQKKALVDQVEQLVGAGVVVTAAGLSVDTGEAVAELVDAMVLAGVEATRQVVAEAQAQGVALTGAHVLAPALEPTAAEVADALADGLKTVAADAASAAEGEAAAEVVAAVEAALDGMSDAAERRALGGALHGTMNTARTETLKGGPIGAIYATELNDSHTCQPCHEIDGRWLGNTDDMALIERSYPGGAFGGYVHCLGGVQCRGTIVGVWRQGSADVGGAQE